MFSLSQVGQAQVLPTYKRYTVENGLPSSHAYHLIQDRLGFIWIATDQGVAKFNGYSFRHFTAKDGLPSNDVWRLSEDKNDRIWLSTFNEIGYLFKDKYYRVSTGDSLNTNGILTHTLFNRGEVKSHYVNSRKLLKIESDSVFEVSKKVILGETKENAFLLNSIRNNLLHLHYYLGAGENGEDWFLFLGDDTEENFIYFYLLFRDKNGNIHYDSSVYSNSFIKYNQIKVHFFPEHNKSIISANDIIYSFDFKNLKKLFKIERKNFTDEIRSFKLNQNEYVIQDGETYAYNITTGKKRQLNLPKNEFFASIIEDNEGNLWTASDNGITFFSKEQNIVSYLKHSSVNTAKNFLSVYKDLKDRIWFGTDNGLLFYLDKQSKLHSIEITIEKLRLTSEILSITDNPSGGIIIGGNFGILNISEKDIANKVVERSFSPIHNRSLTTDNYQYYTSVIAKNAFYNGTDNVYVAGPDGYFSYSNNSPVSTRTFLQRGERVYSIINTPEDIIYLGRKSGLYKVKNGIEELVLPIPISTLHHDSNGLWVGTEGSGIYLIRDERQIHFSETIEKTIKAIAPDEKGNIWFITNNDICQIITQEEDKYELKFSKTANGLSVSLFNNLIINNGIVYFCTNFGVQYMPVIAFDWKKRSQEFFFTNLQINGISVSLKDNYDLSYNENCLEINYVSLEYNKPDEVIYEYKMEGLDTLWRKSNNLKQDFWFLQPGTYTFYLKAGLNSQNISETKKITFYIATPLWKKTWFWGLIALSFVIIVGYISYLRSKRIIKEERRKAQIEDQIADMRLQALQSQMNPHFIFNSLQAIQDYIFDRNEEQANKYLVKFSRLMRLILESSRKKFILLSEEIRLIELYVSLEQLRFSDQFSYEVSLGKNIEKETLLIPSMIIQPFIENAVNHGLFHKKDGKGLLSLSITKSDNYLIIIVTDNGVGLDAARAIKQKMKHKEASRALEIVRERTNLYNRTRDEDINFKIENRLDAQGKTIGTIVTLKLILPSNSLPKIEI